MDEIEIPEAIREEVSLPQKSRSGFPVVFGIILLFSFAGLLSALFFYFNQKPAANVKNQPTKPPTVPKPKVKSGDSPALVPKPTASQPHQAQPKQVRANPPKQVQAKPSQPSKTNLLGHLPYDVAPPEKLVPITSDGKIKMRPSAAEKFKQMQAAAQADGVTLVAVSAFRTTQAQSELFFSVKEQRVEDAVKRAKVSAPPGYSEHHTGYAIDIGDGHAPATHVEPEFADTAAFKWLQQNALKYSFELSFPPNNEQGVSYEPWHWRFVGDRHSLETFYKVRN